MIVYRDAVLLLAFGLLFIGCVGPDEEAPTPQAHTFTNLEALEENPDLDVPYVPTPQPVVDTMLALANVTENDTVYDLGSGDGRIVITAARRHNAHGVGIDLDPLRVQEARANSEKAGVSDRVTFREADLFDVDLREATVVTLYLLPELNEKLRPKLFR
jgi:ribosomal protein L11 methylase PrmA